MLIVLRSKMNSSLDDLSDTSTAMATNTTPENTSITGDYEYDYNSSVGYLPLEELIPVTLVYGVTLILGLVGNVLVIVSVARFKKMQNVTNVFLLSLATADLLLVVICVPVKCAAFFSYTWTFGEVLCKLVNYLQNISIICSVMNLTGLSLERYYAILHPMKAKYTCTLTLARKTVIVIWIMSIVLALPTLAGQTHKMVGSRRTAFWCVLDWESPVLRMLYGLYMFLIILVIPFILMTFAYISICWRLWLMRYRKTESMSVTGEDDQQQGISIMREPSLRKTGYQRPSDGFMVRKSATVGGESKTRRQVIKMLVAVVILFLLCWGPIMINNLLVAFAILDDLHMGYLKHMRQSFLVLSYFNSCVNPVVYGFMSKNFRNSFRNTLALLCRTQAFLTVDGNGVVRYSFQTRSTSFISNRTNVNNQELTEKVKTVQETD